MKNIISTLYSIIVYLQDNIFIKQTSSLIYQTLKFAKKGREVENHSKCWLEMIFLSP